MLLLWYPYTHWSQNAVTTLKRWCQQQMFTSITNEKYSQQNDWKNPKTKNYNWL